MHRYAQVEIISSAVAQDIPTLTYVTDVPLAKQLHVKFSLTCRFFWVTPC